MHEENSEPEEAAPNGTGQALVQFIRRLGAQGKLKANTSGAYASAVEKILEIDDGWQERDVRGLDIDEQCERFVNLRHTAYTPSSLTTYKTRFAKSLEMYRDYLEDPAGWRAPKSRKTSRAKSTSDLSINGERDASASAGKPVVTPRVPAGLVQYPFPLRPNLLAYLSLPADMTSEESARVVQFVNALGQDAPRQLPELSTTGAP